ncbi:hypothetical protein CLMAG_42070 [Clostridium magnum DSM 2767]|uniref:Uncharacterized protein n=1 Tax=Clostridium magnum DSM 2767 TaxID=1121326 RepID=A0A161X8E4_9CLOT|nr:hypothetical protein CLMAG_42070 [Clostridium magnum DSM 2767]SHH85100.1 hypothetical protein SAMN02745944_01584 [Clostridium magnum DSM 2767]
MAFITNILVIYKTLDLEWTPSDRVYIEQRNTSKKVEEKNGEFEKHVFSRIRAIFNYIN